MIGHTFIEAQRGVGSIRVVVRRFAPRNQRIVSAAPVNRLGG